MFSFLSGQPNLAIMIWTPRFSHLDSLCLDGMFINKYLSFCRLDEDGKVLTPEELLYRVCISDYYIGI